MPIKRTRTKIAPGTYQTTIHDGKGGTRRSTSFVVDNGPVKKRYTTTDRGTTYTTTHDHGWFSVKKTSKTNPSPFSLGASKRSRSNSSSGERPGPLESLMIIFVGIIVFIVVLVLIALSELIWEYKYYVIAVGLVVYGIYAKFDSILDWFDKPQDKIQVEPVETEVIFDDGFVDPPVATETNKAAYEAGREFAKLFLRK